MSFTLIVTNKLIVIMLNVVMIKVVVPSVNHPLMISFALYGYNIKNAMNQQYIPVTVSDLLSFGRVNFGQSSQHHFCCYGNITKCNFAK
jgi:hypothetical protein